MPWPIGKKHKPESIEKMKAFKGKRHFRHGACCNYKIPRLYRIWSGMKGRCYNQASASYPSYGGRGITICEAWRNDFAVFRSWALSNGYSDSLRAKRRRYGWSF